MSSSHSTASTQPSHTSTPLGSAEHVTPHLESSDGPAVATPASTGPLTLVDALARARSSPGWIGNLSGLTQDVEWIEDSGGRSFFLRPKSDTTGSNMPVDDAGNVLVCWVGQVATNGSTLRADGGWKPYFRDAHRHKRIVRAIKPPTSLSQDIASLWETQLKGAKAVVERSRRMEDGSEPKVGFCFLEGDTGSLKARNSMFKASLLSVDTWETDTPAGFEYSTWDMTPEVRAALDDVQANGYIPRVLEAYDKLDHLIHPNQVPRTLTGATVYVTCTLEKMLFKGPKFSDGRQWQVYANIVKVQVIDSATPGLTSTLPITSSSKRKASDMDDDRQPRRRLDIV